MDSSDRSGAAQTPVPGQGKRRRRLPAAGSSPSPAPQPALSRCRLCLRAGLTGRRRAGRGKEGSAGGRTDGHGRLPAGSSAPRLPARAGPGRRHPPPASPPSPVLPPLSRQPQHKTPAAGAGRLPEPLPPERRFSPSPLSPGAPAPHRGSAGLGSGSRRVTTTALSLPEPDLRCGSLGPSLPGGL